jgi:hypothetical protein
MSALRKIAFLLLLTSAPALAWAQARCVPLTHGQDVASALNRFWGASIPLCQIPAGSRNAYADRGNWVVWADQSWLDWMAQQHGQFAAVGILAHEWGHMVQGNISGTAAELQADCLAGVFMKGWGLSWSAAEQLARANLFAGDAEWSLGGHGTGQQRVNAVRRGYVGFVGQPPQQLPALCPASAF